MYVLLCKRLIRPITDTISNRVVAFCVPWKISEKVHIVNENVFGSNRVDNADKGLHHLSFDPGP